MAEHRLQQLFVNEEMVTSPLHPVGPGNAVVFSSRSPDRENGANEDSAATFQVGPQSGVLVVADGAGGFRGGDRASGIAIDAVRSSLLETTEDESQLRYNIINAIERANQSVMDLGIGAATTLALVEIRSDVIRPYHVGDSEILVVGQRGKVKLQIVPHSPVGYAVESGMLDENSAMHHEDRHLVSNLIGSPEMHIQVGAPFTLSQRDTVLLASDGLADNLHVEEIVEWIRKGPLQRAAQGMADKALARMKSPAAEEPSKPDDLTFILFRRSG